MKNVKHLIHWNDKAAIIEKTDFWSSAYWGEVQRKFALAAGAKDKDGPRFLDYATMTSLYPDCVVEGVYYTWELAGAAGASFQLFKLPDVTAEQLDRAKAHLRRERDVVRMSVVRITKMVQFELPPMNQLTHV